MSVEVGIEWRESASCRSTDPELFFPTDVFALMAAKTVCEGCPVRRPCLHDGLNDAHGIWGGWTETERRRLRQRLAHTRPKSHIPLVIDRAADVGPHLLHMQD